MTKPREHIDPRDFDAASAHGSDDLRLPPGDQYAIHVATKPYRIPRHISSAESGMMVLVGLCLMGIAWMLIWR